MQNDASSDMSSNSSLSNFVEELCGSSMEWMVLLPASSCDLADLVGVSSFTTGQSILFLSPFPPIDSKPTNVEAIDSPASSPFCCLFFIVSKNTMLDAHSLKVADWES